MKNCNEHYKLVEQADKQGSIYCLQHLVEAKKRKKKEKCVYFSEPKFSSVFISQPWILMGEYFFPKIETKIRRCEKNVKIENVIFH